MTTATYTDTYTGQCKCHTTVTRSGLPVYLRSCVAQCTSCNELVKLHQVVVPAK